MILIMYNTYKILILFIFVFNVVVIRGDAELYNNYFDDYTDEEIPANNNSLPANSTVNIKNSTVKQSSLSPIKSTPLLNATNSTKNSIFFRKQSTSSLLSSTLVTSQQISTSETSRKTPIAVPSITPYVLVSYLVDQFNHYRNIDIMSRIQQCDSNMKLYDMCETYSFDNHTYSLIRESNVEFQSLNHLYDVLIDRIVVQKLSKYCPTGEWCLGNLTDSDIRFTLEVLQKRGHSFCLLERCSHRLTVHTTTCPSISPRNISTPTLKLFPMLCALYKEQQNWNTPKCINEIIYLLHILYAFWPQLETCYHIIATGSGGCTSECLLFDTIFHKFENQCDRNASFLARVPILAWYRLIDLKQLCSHETTVTKSPFISSVQNFISSNLFWYRLHQRPVYAALFIIIVICIVISFSLCLYIMSKNDYNSNTRRIDDNYEYTRLHDSTFDLGTNTEITNMDSTSNESQFDLNHNHRLSEHHRLL